MLTLVGIVVALTWVTGGVYLAIFAAVGLLLAPPLMLARRRLRARRRAAGKQSICTFARSFELRKTDTWIVRAVFEALQDRRDVPFSASSRLEEDLLLDGDDLEELSLIVLQRADRHFDSTNSRLFVGKTINDLVTWFQSLPHRSRLPA